jgi:antitoxin component YwqK of YwqJK toxin-antitoxin module
MDLLGTLPTILDILPWDAFTENIFAYFYPKEITKFQSINKRAKQLISESGRRIYEVCLHREPHGQEVERDDYGHIRSRRHYRDGKAHGIFEWYISLTPTTGSSTVLLDSQTWKMGKLHGLRTTHGRGGTVILSVEHYVNGKLNGERKEFHENGQLRRRCLYEYNKKQGKEEAWFASGQVWTEKHWKDGLAHGEERHWLESGKLRIKPKFFENGEELSRDSVEGARKRARYDNNYKLLAD